MSFGEGEPHFDSPHRAQRPSIAPSTPGYENDDMGFMNGLPNIGGIGSPGMGLGFGSVHLTPSQGPSFMSPRLSGHRQRLFASSSAVLSPFSETATPASEKQLLLKFGDHHETPRRALMPTFCREPFLELPPHHQTPFRPVLSMTELVVHHDLKPNKPSGSAPASKGPAAPVPASTVHVSAPPPSASQVRKRKRTNSDQVTCKCKKSGCLQMYCDCFAAGKKCEGCACSDCKNDGLHQDDFLAAIKRIKANNPHAFEQKIIPEGQAVIHSKGCNCKNSHCLKRYCECYAAGVQCSSKCKCISCQNGKPPGDDQDGEGEKSCSPPSSAAKVAASPVVNKGFKAEYNMSPRGRLQLHFNNQVHFGGPMSSPPSTPHNGHHPNNHVTPYHNMVASFPPNSPSLAELRQFHLRMQMSPMSPL